MRKGAQNNPTAAMQTPSESLEGAPITQSEIWGLRNNNILNSFENNPSEFLRRFNRAASLNFSPSENSLGNLDPASVNITTIRSLLENNTQFRQLAFHGQKYNWLPNLNWDENTARRLAGNSEREWYNAQMEARDHAASIPFIGGNFSQKTDQILKDIFRTGERQVHGGWEPGDWAYQFNRHVDSIAERGRPISNSIAALSSPVATFNKYKQHGVLGGSFKFIFDALSNLSPVNWLASASTAYGNSSRDLANHFKFTRGSDEPVSAWLRRLRSSGYTYNDFGFDDLLWKAGIAGLDAIGFAPVAASGKALITPVTAALRNSNLSTKLLSLLTTPTSYLKNLPGVYTALDDGVVGAIKALNLRSNPNVFSPGNPLAKPFTVLDNLVAGNNAGNLMQRMLARIATNPFYLGNALTSGLDTHQTLSEGVQKPGLLAPLGAAGYEALQAILRPARPLGKLLEGALNYAEGHAMAMNAPNMLSGNVSSSYRYGPNNKMLDYALFQRTLNELGRDTSLLDAWMSALSTAYRNNDTTSVRNLLANPVRGVAGKSQLLKDLATRVSSMTPRMNLGSPLVLSIRDLLTPNKVKSIPELMQTADDSILNTDLGRSYYNNVLRLIESADSQTLINFLNTFASQNPNAEQLLGATLNRLNAFGNSTDQPRIPSGNFETTNTRNHIIVDLLRRFADTSAFNSASIAS